MSLTFAEFLADEQLQAVASHDGDIFALLRTAGVVFPDWKTYHAWVTTRKYPIHLDRGGTYDDAIKLSKTDLEALAHGAVILYIVYNEYAFVIYCEDEPE